MEQHINWELIDDATFNEFRYADAQTIAEAYVAESMVDHPNYDRMASLHELGQARFSIRNSYESRVRLFRVFVEHALKASYK